MPVVKAEQTQRFPLKRQQGLVYDDLELADIHMFSCQQQTRQIIDEPMIIVGISADQYDVARELRD